MDWNLIQELFDGQGLVFWGALAAVALGLTLLSVSIVFQVRRMAGGRGLRLGGLGRRGPRASDSGITVTADGYTAAGGAMAAARPQPTTEEPEVAPEPAEVPTADARVLRDRLRLAGDRLAAIHSSLAPRDARATRRADSPLKGALAGVDYVYKSGQA